MNPIKIFRHFYISWLFLFLTSGYITCQDIIYKNDSTILRVKILNFNGKTIIYQLPGDTVRFNYYLSKLSVDSLRYFDGRSMDFTYTRQEKGQAPHQIPRNYLELDLFNLSYGNPYIAYERLSVNGRNSFLVGLFIHPGPRDNYWDEYRSPFQYINYDPYSFFAKIGFNHYPFNYSLTRTGTFRVSTGLSVNLGSYRKIDWDKYYQYGYDEYKAEQVAAFSLMGNTQCKLYLGNVFLIYADLDFSVLPFFTFFCPQIGLSIGF